MQIYFPQLIQFISTYAKWLVAPPTVAVAARERTISLHARDKKNDDGSL